MVWENFQIYCVHIIDRCICQSNTYYDPQTKSPPSKGRLPITTRHHFSKNLFSLSRKGGRKLYIDIGFEVWVKFPVKLCCCYKVTFLHPAMSNIVLTLESENQFGFGWLFCGMFSACSLENCVEDKCLHAFCCTGENGTTCNTFAHFMPQCLLDKNLLYIVTILNVCV